MHQLLSFVVICLGITGVFGSGASAQCENEWRPGFGIPGIAGEVHAMAVWDPDGSGPSPPQLVIGGRFKVAGNVVANNIVTWDGQKWHALGSGIQGDSSYPEPFVASITEFDGKLVVAGGFTHAGGTLSHSIATWNGTSWSGLGAGLNYAAYAVTVYNGQLIVGGNFRKSGGELVNGVARWNGIGWETFGGGTDGIIYSLGMYRNELVAGGYFESIGHQQANSVARWDGITWHALDSGLSAGPDIANVFASAEFNDELVVGGRFDSAGGISASCVARWNGSRWQSLGTGVSPGAYAQVSAIARFNGKLIVAGFFESAGNVPANSIATWDGTAWGTLGVGTTYQILALMNYRNDLIVGGSFYAAGGQQIPSIASWNGADWHPLGRGTNGPVLSLTFDGGTIVAGGSFTTIEGSPANHIARWDGSTWHALGTGTDGDGVDSFGDVAALTVYNGDLIAGGYFTLAGGIPAEHIARWSGSGWSTLGSGVDGVVRSLAVFDGQLIAAGEFTFAGEVRANGIASWDGAVWRSLGTGVDGVVVAVTNFAGELIAAGTFNEAGGVAANNIARWDGGVWRPLGSGLTWTSHYTFVGALTSFRGELVAGGSISSAGGVPVSSIAKWNGTSWASIGGGVYGQYGPVVYSLASYQDDLIVGGEFSWPEKNIARWNGTSWSGFDRAGAGMDYDVLTIATGDNEFFAGGGFLTAGEYVSVGFARWGPQRPVIVEGPSSQRVRPGERVSFSVTATSENAASYQWRRDGLALTDHGRIEGAQTPTLRIRRATPQDRGAYDVIVTNACGSVNSEPASLEVQSQAQSH